MYSKQKIIPFQNYIIIHYFFLIIKYLIIKINIFLRRISSDIRREPHNTPRRGGTIVWDLEKTKTSGGDFWKVVVLILFLLHFSFSSRNENFAARAMTIVHLSFQLPQISLVLSTKGKCFPSFLFGKGEKTRKWKWNSENEILSLGDENIDERKYE